MKMRKEAFHKGPAYMCMSSKSIYRVKWPRGLKIGSTGSVLRSWGVPEQTPLHRAAEGMKARQGKPGHL